MLSTCCPYQYRRSRPTARVIGAIVTICVLASRAGAQILPSEPIQLAGGRLVVAGEASASLGSRDRGYFNYTDYENNALRMLRFAATAAFHVGERITLLWELRTENWDSLQPYALYVRIRPWRSRAIDIQAGRIPPVFGAFARRVYGVGNPLIGYPLAYQYLTSVRADAFAATPDDILRSRGRGWFVHYPLGVPEPQPGLPLVSAFRWDTGVQVRMGSRPLQVSAALTSGTLSNPRFNDGNGGKQLAGRARFQPALALIVGISAARGEYGDRRVLDALPVSKRRLHQRAFGVDFEYSRGHWIAKAEGILSAWDVPATAQPLRAAAILVEGRYTLRPGLYVAGRVDRLTFSRITGTLFGGQPTSWDAPASRLEVGSGYYVQRNVIVKFAYQENWRDGGFARRGHYASVQLLYWF